jgi:phospholipase/carboxylesterase
MPVVAWRRPAKSGPATPLVVLLHGRGADEYDLLDIADFLPRAYTYASVRAPVPVEGGGYTWFENRGVARPIPQSIASSTAALRAWLDDPAIGCANQTCYLVGFSAGMMMAAALALDDPARFAGAVLLSGAIAFDGTRHATDGRLTGLRAFYGRGTLDDVIPQDLVSQTDAYLRERSGASLTFRAYPHGHSISRAELGDIATWFEG